MNLAVISKDLKDKKKRTKSLAGIKLGVSGSLNKNHTATPIKNYLTPSPMHETKTIFKTGELIFAKISYHKVFLPDANIITPIRTMLI